MVEDFRNVFDDEETGRCADPNQAVEVFAEAVELFGQVGRAVLIDDVLVQDFPIVSGAFGAFGVEAEDAAFVDASARDEFDAAAVMENLVDQRSGIEFLVV